MTLLCQVTKPKNNPYLPLASRLVSCIPPKTHWTFILLLPLDKHPTPILTRKNMSKAASSKEKEKPMESPETQEWGNFYKRKIIVISSIIIVEIKVTPTHIMDWFEEELMKAWSHIFLLTSKIWMNGYLTLSDPAWFNWHNLWWNFLSDKTSRKESQILGWKGLPLRSRELILGDLSQPDTLMEGRMLVDRPIVVNTMGDMEGRKIIQVFASIRTFSFVVSQRERMIGVMEHVMVFIQGEGFTKSLLKDMGWTIMDQMRTLPPIDECPGPIL